MDKIKILKVEPGEPPFVKEIANDFKASQAEVEGDIECVGFGDGWRNIWGYRVKRTAW